MLSDGRRLGAHLPLGAGMVRAVERAHEIGAEALQIFCDNPTAWRRRPTLPKELPRFRERLGELDIRPLAIHAAYLVNLAGDEPTFHAQSIELLTSDLRTGIAYGASFVNVHIGSHRGAGAEAGVQALATGVAAVLARVPPGAGVPRLVLEDSAGSGLAWASRSTSWRRSTARSIEHGVDPARIGYCLDTAHLWGAGYDLRSRATVEALLDAFGRRIGLDRLVMVHLNDSRSELGSRLDRHEHLGAGRIGARGLRNVLTHPALGHVAFLIETPGMDEGYDAINLQRARDLAAGRPLAELPREAFELRRSRSRSGPAEDPDDLPLAEPA